MKCNLLFIFLLSASQTLFAQTNPFKDEAIKKDKDRRFIAEHKIKRVDEYVMAANDSLATRDSSMICQFYYEKKGTLTQTVAHTKMYTLVDRVGKDIEIEVNYDYEYNANGSLSKIKYTGNETFRTPTTTYEYDSKNNLVRYYEAADDMITFEPNSLTGQFAFEYDNAGNVVSKKLFSSTGVLWMNNIYVYNSKNQLTKTTYQWGGNKFKKGDYVECQYTETAGGLTRTEDIYNKDGVLTGHKEYIYNANNDQVKGYDTRDGVKVLVWDYKYNANNQLIESRGGPAALAGLYYKDVRRDGFAHLFYSYDKYGTLSQIKKYEADANGVETLTTIQKFIYKRY